MELTEAVVLDMDDTLYLERDYVRSGFRAVAAHVQTSYGLTGFDDTCWRLFLSGIRGDVFNRAAAHHDTAFTDAQVADLVAIYRDHEPDIHLEDPVRQTLERLAVAHRLVLLTGGPPIAQRRKIQSLGITRYFEHIRLTGLDGPEKDKPCIIHWQEVETALGLTGQQITCIGDNPAKDVLPSLARGWQAIRIRIEGSLHGTVDTPEGAIELRSLHSLISEEWPHRVGMRASIPTRMNSTVPDRPDSAE